MKWHIKIMRVEKFEKEIVLEAADFLNFDFGSFDIKLLVNPMESATSSFT